MSDHLDAPGNIMLEAARVGPPLGDPKTDITDLYAFKSSDPGPCEKSVLVLNVNPLTLARAFDENGEYLIKIDTNGDAIEDIVFRFTFTAPDHHAEQWATVERICQGETQTILGGAPVSFGRHAKIIRAGDYKFFAGVRSDPFFFDLLGFINNLTFNQGDFFADKNVFGIVLEVPNRALGETPAATSMWGRTRVRKNGQMVMDDRVGRPFINAPFNAGTDQNVFNELEPDQDATAVNGEGVTFRQSFASALLSLSAKFGHPYTAAQAADLAVFLLPDLLPYDFSQPVSFAGNNGRNLRDDVMSFSLGRLTNGGLTTDNVGPHTDYLDDFPYLGNPHTGDAHDRS